MISAPQIETLYCIYLDTRMSAAEPSAQTSSEGKLAVYFARQDGPMLTRYQLRAELDRYLHSLEKVDSIPDQPETIALRSEAARRDDVLRAAARELLATDPTNGLLDSTLNLVPAHEIRLARLRHAIAQAKRESAGSRTQCANRWIAIAATLGIDPAKDPPTDIAGFIDPHGPGALVQQQMRIEWEGLNSLGAVLETLPHRPMRPQPLRFQDPRALRELFAIALPTGYRLDYTADSPPLWAWASETDSGKERTSIGMAVRHAWDHANGRLPYPQS